MPIYPVECPAHGRHEVFRPISLRHTVRCEAAPPRNEVKPERGRRRCVSEVQRVFDRAYLPGVRIDAGGEDARLPERVADGSAKFNVGLPGIDTVVGQRPDGKPRLAYRPITNHEVGSNKNAREIAKRNGLEMIGSGSYRSVVP